VLTYLRLHIPQATVAALLWVRPRAISRAIYAACCRSFSSNCRVP
jgi:hypothetical protein